MQKKFLAVAVALVSVPALGQLSMYGTLDVAIQQLDLGKRADGVNVSSLRLASGLLSTPRLGFKGESALGVYGLHAGFQLETGFVINGGLLTQYTSNFNSALNNIPPMTVGQPSQYAVTRQTLFDRQARVYVAGTMGEISFGKQANPFSFVAGEIDPAHGGTTTTSSSLFNAVPYTLFVDNSIAYHTPEYNGLAACVMVSMNEPLFPLNAEQDKYMVSDSGRLMSVSLEYSAGPLYAGVAYSTENFGSVADVATTSAGHNALYLAGVSYDFGFLKPYASFFSGKRYSPLLILPPPPPPDVNPTTEELNRNVTVVSLGMSVPVGEYGYVLANFGSLTEQDKTSVGAYLFGLGYAYSFNRSTTLYAAYSKLSNTNTSAKDAVGMNLTLDGALPTSPALPQATSNPQSLEVGMRYRF